MSKSFFLRTSSILTPLKMAVKLKSNERNFQTIQDVRIYIEKDSDVALMQTHSALKPASINASIEIHNELGSSLDITIAIKPFIKCINNLGDPEYIKITYEEHRLRIHAACFSGELFGDTSPYYVLEKKPRQFINYQHTNLIVDYKQISIPGSDNFACRKKQRLVVGKLTKLAKTSKKKKDVQVKLEQVGNLILMHLFTEGCYLRLQLLESDSVSEVTVFLDLAQLTFLGMAIDKLIKSKLGAIYMKFGEQSEMILFCGGIICEFNMPPEILLLAEPQEPASEKLWCEVSNFILQNCLDEIDVTSRTVEDIIELQMTSDGILNAKQTTFLASADSQINSQIGKSVKDWPVVVVNRTKFKCGISCFHSYEKLKMHCSTSSEGRLIIKPSSNSDELFMLATSEIPESK